MRLPTNLGLKIYLIIFAIFTFSSLISLSRPDGITYTYYNILLTLHAPAGIWYILAILNALISFTILIPLYRRSFNLTGIHIKLFKWLFFVRILTTLLGHNYEVVIIKSAFQGASILMGIIALSIWLLFLYPSFKEHFIYSFRSN